MAKEKELSLDKLLAKCSQSAHEIITAQKSLPVLSTGVFPLDLALGAIDPVRGNGGVRSRDMIEIMAMNGAGKTGIAYAAMAATMKRFPGTHKVVVAYFSEPPDEDQFIRMAVMGVDPERVAWIGLECNGNQALNQLLKIVGFEEIKLAVIDSIAAISVAADEDKDLEDNAAVSGLALIYNRFAADFRDRSAYAPLIALNHYRLPISSGRPGQTAPPSVLDPSSKGGKTKDYLGKARIILSTVPKWEQDNKHSFAWNGSSKATVIEEVNIKAKIPRNKYAPPMRECGFSYNTSTFKFNNEEATIKLAATFATKVGTEWKSLIDPGVFLSGAYYTIAGEKFQGIGNAVSYLEGQPDLMEKIQNQIIPYGKQFFMDQVNVEDELDK